MRVLATDVLPTAKDRAGLSAMWDQKVARYGSSKPLLAGPGYGGEDFAGDWHE